MKTLTRIALLCAVLTAFLCASAYAVNDAPSVQVTSKPTVNGSPIGTYHLSGLEEIAVPVQVSADAPASVNLFASFYARNNKYIGMGATTATVDHETSFVIMPVENAVTGAEVLKMAVTDADFRPLSVSSYSLTGGGGGGSGGGPNVTYSYYLKAAASFTSENGGSGAAYVMKTQPTENTDLSEASPLSATFQYQNYSPACAYYVIFVPENGSELAYPRIVQGPASNVYRLPVTLKSAPNAIVYRVWTNGSLSESNAPTVTMKGIFRGNGGGGSSSGGGGGSSSGGGGGGYTPPVVTKTTYYLLAQAQVVPAEHGRVFMTNVAPTATTTAPTYLSATMKALFNKEFASNEQPNLTGYVLFLPDEGYELDAATVSVTKPVTGADGQTATEYVTHSDPVSVTLADGQTAYWISFTATGNTNSSTDAARTPDVTITAGFKASPAPPPVEEVIWMITTNVSGGFVSFSETPDFPAPLTASLGQGAQILVRKGESKTIYVALSPNTANGFRPGNPNLTRTDNGAVMANPTPQVSFDETLYVYPITVTNIQANATTVLEGAFDADPLSLYDVTVLDAKYFDSANTVTPPEGVVLLNPYVEAPTARANTDVTLYVPVTKGYRVHAITVTGASGKTYDATLSSDEDADPLEYVFTMPDEAVNVQVVFENVPSGGLDHQNETPVLSGAVGRGE